MKGESNLTKLHFRIRKDNDLYFHIIKTREKKDHYNNMFKYFMKNLPTPVYNCFLKDSIYIYNPPDELIVEEGVKMVEAGLFRFGKRGDLYKSWLNYKEENYINEPDLFPTFENILQKVPLKCVFYISDNDIIVDVTFQKKCTPDYKRDIRDVLSSKDIEPLTPLKFLSLITREGYEKYNELYQ